MRGLRGSVGYRTNYLGRGVQHSTLFVVCLHARSERGGGVQAAFVLFDAFLI